MNNFRNEEDSYLVDKALFYHMKTKSNPPVTLTQYSAKKLILIMSGIIEYVYNVEHELCYCHKYSGCVLIIFFLSFIVARFANMITNMKMTFINL